MLGRSNLYVKHLQSKYELPDSQDGGYSKAYFLFLQKVSSLRILNITEDAILKLWITEKKIMRLLHADQGSSPTWFLDECDQKKYPRRRLLLSNHDTGTDLFLKKLQPQLPGYAGAKELFEGHEMGEDIFKVLDSYLRLYGRICRECTGQIEIVRSAAVWASRLPAVRSEMD